MEIHHKPSPSFGSSPFANNGGGTPKAPQFSIGEDDELDDEELNCTHDNIDLIKQKVVFQVQKIFILAFHFIGFRRADR